MSLIYGPDYGGKRRPVITGRRLFSLQLQSAQDLG